MCLPTILLLSKIENTPAEELGRITAILRMINSHAEILDTPYFNQPDLENISFTGVAVDTVNDLLELLTALLRGYFGTVYRAKGFTQIGGQWTKFDIVDRQYTVAVCDPMPESKAVIIGQKLDRERLRKAFTAAAPLSYRRYTADRSAEYVPKRGKFFQSSSVT